MPTCDAAACPQGVRHAALPQRGCRLVAPVTQPGVLPGAPRWQWFSHLLLVVAEADLRPWCPGDLLPFSDVRGHTPQAQSTEWAQAWGGPDTWGALRITEELRSRINALEPWLTRCGVTHTDLVEGVQQNGSMVTLETVHVVCVCT